MITLEDLRVATGGQLFGDAGASQFGGAAVDVSRVQTGYLFVTTHPDPARRRRDIIAAVAAGATGLLSESPPDFETSGLTVLLVGDVAVALEQWATYTLRQHGTILVGVTGALSKTITCEAISAVLSSRYNTYKCSETDNSRYGLPMALSGIEPHHQIAVIEFPDVEPELFSDIVSTIQPQVLVVTNMNPISRPATAHAARAINRAQSAASQMLSGGTLVINQDDHYSKILLETARANSLTYGCRVSQSGNSPGLQAHDPQMALDRVGFTLYRERNEFKGQYVSGVGLPTLYAGLAALAVGLVLNVDLEQGLLALRTLQPVVGRMAVRAAMRDTYLIDNSFDASFEATEAALEWFEQIDAGIGRKFLVLGEVSRPGERCSSDYEALGVRAASFVDGLIAYGEAASVAAHAAVQAGMNVSTALARYRVEEVVRSVTDVIRAGDIVLVDGGSQARLDRVTNLLLRTPVGRTLPVRRVRSAARTISSGASAGSQLQIDLKTIAGNVIAAKRALGDHMALMAMVKCNAYGHGAVPIASTALASGASMVGVATAGEAFHLRASGISAPILVTGEIPEADIERAVFENLLLTIGTPDRALMLLHCANLLKSEIKVHVKVDSGNSGDGLRLDEVATLIRDIVKSDLMHLDGLYTCLPALTWGERIDVAQASLALFTTVADNLKAAGLKIPFVHALASEALLLSLGGQGNTVRLGRAMYGISPIPGKSLPAAFRQAMAWTSSVSHVQRVRAGTVLGRAPSYQTRQDEKVAVVPVGYLDGLRVAPDATSQVLINGQKCPLLADIDYHHVYVGVSSVADVDVGDEVILIGRQDNQAITLEDRAQNTGLAAHEMLFTLSPALPRVYDAD